MIKPNLQIVPSIRCGLRTQILLASFIKTDEPMNVYPFDIWMIIDYDVMDVNVKWCDFSPYMVFLMHVLKKAS